MHRSLALPRAPAARRGPVGTVVSFVASVAPLLVAPLLVAAAGVLSWPPAALRAGELDVLISEVHYHPPEGSGSLLEFVELANLADSTVDVSGWRISEGVAFILPDGAAIPSRGFLVLAGDAASVRAAYGLSAEQVVGNWVGGLSNGGETLALRTADGRLVDRVAWDDEGAWPGTPDGDGPSLERTRLFDDGEQQHSWRASIPMGGTPGAENSTLESIDSTVVIAAGDDWRYFKGTREPASPRGRWASPSFSDTSWATGPSGFGYGDGDDATLLTDMRNNYKTVYIRKRFTLPPLDQIESLLLSVVYDDAYVAYLNGVEVWRSSSAGGPLGVPVAYNASAAAGHENRDGSDVVDLAGSPRLQEGENLLALQGINVSSGSSDFSLIPSLTLVSAGGSGIVEPRHDLEINEVVAGASAAASWVEVYNEGDVVEDLAGYRLVSDPTGAGGYAFPAGTTLAPGGFIVVSGDLLPFAILDTTQWLGLETPEGFFVDGIETENRPAGRPFGRFPDGDGDLFVLDSATRGAPNVVTLDDRIAITEVRYHAPFARPTEEFIELQNRSGAPVDVSGWRLKNAVRYTLPPGTTIPAGGRLVLSRDPPAVEARFGIAGVLGPWVGKLSNSDEKIVLVDGLGNRADVVHYADDGLWPGSTLSSGPDGFGKSIELLNADMENNHGSAWSASSGNGTPGAANSRASANPPPVIRGPYHSPPEPHSGEPVTVTARVADEGGVASVNLFWRVDGAGSFSRVPMADDGLSADGRAGDGRWGAEIPGRPDGTIVQFYIEARDTTGGTRKYPASAPRPTLLYQVDDSTYPLGLPLYRIVTTAANFRELTTRGVNSDVLLDATFIRGGDVTYNVGLRYRGEHSRDFEIKSFRVQFSHDQRFEGIKRLNLLAEDPQINHIAADVLRRADVPVFQSRVVAVTLNRNFGTAHGGIYARAEAVDTDFVKREFRGDSGGNLYRGLDLGGGRQANLSYRGPNPSDYRAMYVKKTNEELADWTDVVELTDTLQNTPDADYVAAVEALVDVEEWLRFFATEMVMSNQDGAIATSTGEDYFIYHRPSDGRWVIMPWDQNENFRNPGSGIFRMSSASVQRMLRNPAFLKRYLEVVHEIAVGPFDPDVMQPRLDAVRPFFGDLPTISRFVVDQQRAIDDLFPSRLTVGIEPTFLVRSGEAWRFFRGRREPSGGSTAWTSRTFNDATWEEGPSGFGYGDGDDRTLLADMPGNYTTVYARRRFTVADPALIQKLFFSIRYDDGYVAWLNGVEISRRNVSGGVRFDERASGLHEAGANPRVVDVSSFKNRLVAGVNVLAAVGVNASIASSDLTLDPELVTGAEGSGCGDLLFASGSTLSLGGTAPIFETESVEVDGEPASYEPADGLWHHEVTLSPGQSEVLVRALDATGAEVASTTVTVAGAGALTEVSGTPGTRWRASQSPYHVVGDVTVRAGSTLTVEAGTTVLLEPGVSVTVDGTLLVNGTAGEPVTFQSSSCSGEWGGIAFVGSGARGTLNHLEITGSSGPSVNGQSRPGAINLEGGARVTITGLRIADAGSTGVEARDAGTRLEISDSLIERCGEGIHANTAYALIERVTIRDLVGKSDCVDFDNDATPRSVIRGCLFENSPDDGIDLGFSSPLMEDNVIHGMFDKGISLEGASTPEITGTLIYDCNNAIAFKDSVNARVERSTFFGCAIALHAYQKNAGKGSGKCVGESLIAWGNTASIAVEDGGSIRVSYSDVEGGYAGTANRDADPLFVSAAARDFHLRPGSPAIGTGRGGVDMGALPAGGPVPDTFVRGDANEDGVVDISDPIAVLLYLFAGGQPPRCLDAADGDDSGAVDVTDPIFLLGFLFQGGPEPPAPFPAPGADPTSGDPLGCASGA